MPHFFFELCDGFRVADDSGQDFDTLDEARDEAVKSARSMMRDEILRGTLSLGDSIHILDADGQPLEVVRFRDALTILD